MGGEGELVGEGKGEGENKNTGSTFNTVLILPEVAVKSGENKIYIFFNTAFWEAVVNPVSALNMIPQLYS